MSTRSVEAQVVLDGLDEELNAAANTIGTTLVWTAADNQLREYVAAHVDRRAILQAEYDSTEDNRLRIALSTELRLTEQSLARLIKQLLSGLPTPEDEKPPSATTIKARKAARARWDRARQAGAI